MRKNIILFLLVLSILTACSDKNEVKDSPLYEGKNLTIGIVGNVPKVREQNIVFKSIELKDLYQENLNSKYDAVFIMEAYLSEATKAPYAKIYKTSGIPFFFIETKKSFIPFVNKEEDYEEFPDTLSLDYAAGYYQPGEDGTYWGYGLYNDTVNEANILDVYSRIFETIENINTLNE